MKEGIEYIFEYFVLIHLNDIFTTFKFLVLLLSVLQFVSMSKIHFDTNISAVMRSQD